MNQPHHTTIVVNQPQGNGLGVAGFVISLLGFLTCGLISPLGFFLSLAGLLKAPRGLALAGTLLGFIGSAWLWLGGGLMLLGFLGLAGAAALPPVPETAANNYPVTSPPSSEPASSSPIALDGADTPAEPAASEPAPALSAAASGATSESVTPETATSPAPTEPVPVVKAPRKSLRTWKSANGKFEIEAEFVSYANGAVTLEKDDGSRITVPLDKLSEEDNEWVNKKRQ